MDSRHFGFLIAAISVISVSSCAGEGRGIGTIALTLSVEGSENILDGATVPVAIEPSAFLVSFTAPGLVLAKTTDPEEDRGDSHSHSLGWQLPGTYEVTHEDHEEDDYGHEAIIVNLLGDPFDSGGEMEIVELGDIAIGEYTGLLIGISPANGYSRNLPNAEIEERSLYFSGTADCVEPVTLLVEIKDEIHDLINLEINVHQHTHGETSEIHLVLDAGGLFSGIDVCNLEESPADTIVISHESVNADILGTFMNNFSSAFSVESHDH